MATMTIAQALASTATGIIIADTPVNIARALPNPGLVSRVSEFTLNANGASGAGDATTLATLGAQFSRAGFQYTVRDSIAALTNPNNAAGLTVGSAIAVFDNATNLLAAANTALMHQVSSVLMSTSATLTLANLIKLEGEPAFSVLPGQSITMGDSAGNLLSVTPSENRPSIKAYTVTVSSAVDVANATALLALPQFSIAPNITLTVADTAAHMTAQGVLTTLQRFAATPQVVITAADTLINLAASATALNTLALLVNGLTTTMNDNETLSAAQLTALPSLPHFSVAAANVLTLSDTVANLVAISPSVAALAQATTLSQSDVATVAQLATLVSLHGFAAGNGHQLTATDTLAHLAGLTTGEGQVVTGITVQDTVANLVAAHALPTGTTAILATLDGGTYTVAQGAAMLALGAGVTLVPSGPATSLQIADTIHDLVVGNATVTALQSDGAVTVTATDNHTTLAATAAASLVALPGFNAGAYDLSISDSGPALTAVENQVFGQGFTSITVTDGVFAGTEAQLLDPTLHFAGQPNGPVITFDIAPSAQLGANATVSVAQLVALSLLPGFSVGIGVTLTVNDTMSGLIANASLVAHLATAVQVSDSETVTAAGAAQLATIKTAVGNAHFGLGANVVTVSDDGANIANPANAAGVALAGSVTLSVPSIVNATQAASLVGLGQAFSLNGNALIVSDTAANLATLSGSATALNTMHAQVQLSADATLTVATAQPLAAFSSFTAGTHHLSISDTAANLLAQGAAAALALASTVALSQAASVSVAQAITLAALHGFSPVGFLTVADTPAHLATMPSSIATLASGETLAAMTIGNAADFTISAAQLTALQGLPDLSVSGFTNTITVSDTAAALAGIAPSFVGVQPNSLLSHVVPVLSADATVSSITGSTLAHMPGFGLGGHLLAVQDSPGALLSPGSADGIAIATSTGLNAPATVTVAIANALAALHNFAADSNAMTINDTPAQLLTLSNGVLALATGEQIAPLTVGNAADFNLNVMQFTALVAIPHLSLFGPLNVSDTATNLLALATAFSGASPGSQLQLAEHVTFTSLSADATVSVQNFATLESLPSFGLGGHTLSLVDTPTALLTIPSFELPLVSGATLSANDGPWVVSAANASALAHLPAFSAGPGMTVSDNVGNLLASTNSFGLAAATSVTISGDVTVTASQATALHGITGFTIGSHHLTISNGANGLASLDNGTAAMATAIQLSGGGVVTYSQYQAIAALPHFSLNGNVLVVADTATNLLTLAGGSFSLATSTALTASATVTADQAQLLSTLPNLSTTAGLVIVDTAADLLRVVGQNTVPADWAGELLASAVTLSANATVTAAQAARLDLLGARFSNGGFTLTIADTPSALLAGTGFSSIAGQITGYALSANDGPWVVSAAAATALAALPGFSTGPGMTVSDTVANLLASSNAAGEAHAAAVTIPGDVTVTAAQAVGLHGITGFTAGVHQVTIADSAANLAALDVGSAGIATTINVAGNGIVSVSQFQALQALPLFNTNGNTLVISDTATNLLTLHNANTAPAAFIVLQANATLTADQAETLATLPNFGTGAAHLSILDTVAHLVTVTGDGTLPDDWAGELVATTITITQSATVTADQATDLAALGGRLVLGANTLTVSDSAANLLAAGHVSGLALASAVTLSEPEPRISAANATSLAGLANFSKNGNSVTVSDTAAAIALPSNAAGIALADHVQLNGVTSLSVATAESLIGLSNFQTNVAAPLTIGDSLANLLQLALASLPHNNGVLAGTPIALSENETATVAQITALEALPQYALSGHHFSLNGFTLTIMDSARHLASFTPDAMALPTAYVMVGDGTVTAAQADLFATRAVALGDNILTVADTAAALLNGANASGIAIADVLALSGDDTVNAAQAATLFGNNLFTTDGHSLTVSDTAETLVGLSQTIETRATTLALITNQTVNVTTLLGLAELGIKFSLAGHTLTVADNATNLATLNPLETALVTSEHLNAVASVSAATAEKLAALPNFVDDATLTVVDNFANLTGLSSQARAIANHTLLTPDSSIQITVAQALALAALPGFSNAGATVTVVDTIAHLSANGWQSVATSYDVADSVANLVANHASAVVTGAASVTLLGDSVIDTTSIDTLAGIATFSRGTSALVVTDGPDLIAAHAASILAVASEARINSSTPVTAAQAEQLVGLANASELTFSGANHLVVADNFANLSNVANAGGVALAFTITITDTATNLVLATAHNWHGATPFYVLSANASVTGAQATVLAGLTDHFSTAGHTLVMADTAAGVVGNAAALTALGIDAQVSDTVTGIDANVSGLLALDGSLRSVTPTNGAGISADAASGLSPLAGLLSGTPVTVSDTSANIVADTAHLLQLGAHLGSITIADSGPATAAVATGLVPLLSEIANGSMVNVSDTGADLVAQALGLASLGAVLGTVTVADGPNTTAAIAAGLVPIDGNLSVSTALVVTDTASAIVAAADGLAAMRTAGFIQSISTTDETAATIVADASVLNTLHATASIVDTAAHVNANLDGLEAFPSVLGTITFTDDTTQNINVTAAQLGSDAAVFNAIVTPYNLRVSDTTINIQHDLTGVTSNILTTAFTVTAIIATGGGSLTLTEAQVQTPGIDDGGGSVMERFSGAQLVVTNVVAADVNLIADLDVPPASMQVTDTASGIQADLTSGSSALVAQRVLITHITVGDSGTISLGVADVTAAHVDDGAGSVFAKMSGFQLTVTDALVAQIATVAALGVAPTTITVTDGAASIQADLVAHPSHILQNIASIGAITVNDAGTISLTGSQIRVAGVDDGAHSALALMTGETLVVTDALVSDITPIHALSVVPSSVAISDTAAHIQADLRLGDTSSILTYLSSVSGIAVVPSGTISLSESQVQHVGVDDGVASALALMTGETLVVTGVAVADISTILALGVPPATITISDTAAHIQADLISGAQIVPNLAFITAIAVSDAGTISLTVAQITAGGVDDGPGSALSDLSGGSIVVTDAMVADIPTLVGLGVVPTSINVVDSAADVAADLMSGSSVITANVGRIHQISFNDGGTPPFTLSLSVLEADHAAIALINTPYALTVSDTAANIQADLQSGTPYLPAHLGTVGQIVVSDAGTITLTAAQVLAAHVDSAGTSVFTIMTGGQTLIVTNVAVAQISAVAALPVAAASFSVSDTASAIQADLISGSSEILGNIAAITAIAVNDAGTIHLTDAQIQAAGVDDGGGSALALLSGGTIVVTNVPIADIGTILGLGVPPTSIVVVDVASAIASDLTGGSSVLLADHASISAITNSDNGAISLTVAQAEAAGVDDGIHSVFGKMTGGSLTVTGAAVGDLATLFALTVHPTSLDISDTAADIQSDLASGSSKVLAHLGAISGIVVSDSGTITLTAAQAFTAHVDDGAGSVFSVLTGGTLVVTGVLVSQIDAALALAFAPTTITVSDTASDVQHDLTAVSSNILTNLAAITHITVSDSGTITLTDAQIQAAGVDDSGSSALALTTGGTVVVTQVPVADISLIFGLDVPPSSISVVDVAASIQGDLTGGLSELLLHRTGITSITVSDNGAISLTVAQAETAHVDDGATSVFGKMSGGTLTVTGAAVGDIATLGSLTLAPTGLSISDTAANIQADLALATPTLATNLSLISSITVSDAGTITLTETQLRATHVDDGAGSVLALTSGGSLAVTHVLAVDIRTVGGLFVVPDSFAITDSAADLQTDLTSGSSAILAYLGAITGITVSPAGTITLTESQVTAASVDDGAGSALSKMTGLTLAVSHVAVADIATILGLGVAPSSIAISDTAANIQADLTGGMSSLVANRAVITGIDANDSGTISLTVAQVEAAHVDDGVGSVFDKMTDEGLTVTGALVSDIQTLSGLAVRPNVVNVSDTAANIQADIVAGGSSKIVTHPGLIGVVFVNDAGTITLTETQLRASGVDDGIHSALAKTTGGTLAVTNVLAADVSLVAALRAPPTDISITDTAAHLQADLTSGSSGILANLSAISAITVSPAGTITLTETQVQLAGVDDGVTSALAKMTGLTLDVTQVLAADVGTIAALGVAPTAISVTDTAAHIQADLASGSSHIVANIGAITSITVSPSGTITLTDAQVQAAGVDDGAGSALALTTGATLVVTGVSVADIATILGLGVPPTSITVMDSEANLVTDLTGGSSVIAANNTVITSVKPTEATLSVANATALYNALLGVAPLDESGLTITGTSSQLLTAQTGVPAMLAAAAHISMTDDPVGLTAAQATTLSGVLGGVLAHLQTLGIVDTAANLLLSGNAAGIALATDVALNAPTATTAAIATQLAGLHSFDVGAQPITIHDTITNLLTVGNAAGITAATTVTPDADYTVSAATLVQLAALHGFATGGHNITVGDTALAIAGLSQPQLGFTSLAAVTDTSAHVLAGLATLQSNVAGHAHAMSITLTDATTNVTAIVVNAASYAANAATLDDIIGVTGVVEVTGNAAALAALASQLGSDTIVGDVEVTDSAQNILANLTALNSIGAKFSSATITDSTLSASFVSSLLTIPNLSAGMLTISDTGAQIAAALQANGAAGVTFMTSHTVALSANSVVTASQALTLQSLPGLQKGAFTLSVWDTASHLTDSIDGYLAAVKGANIDAVFLKTSGGVATISASTAVALFGIPAFNKNNPDSSSNVLTVQDTAAHIESAFSALNTDSSTIDNIVVSASATVTDAVFGDLLTLHATAGGGVAMTVRDTAANIIANAPSQISGSPSISATTWALTGSASVTTAGAAFLGGLGISAGAFTLTITDDVTVSVTQANNLGLLGSTLHLGGHHIQVSGTVAQMAPLSNAARAIVAPQITDTFANIATLSLGGGLLGGNITVSDSEAPTVAQANAFLAILLAGGNGGIPAANVHFGGHLEAITDTLANIQTMTGSAGWTSNPSVHGDFTLVAADTVANLINPANTAALSAMSGTTLSTNQTVTAANAESLFNIATTINFTLGSHTVTVQDTAANILNVVNADGEALAVSWQLIGDGTVAAADAETLLTASKFDTNGHILTVSDFSSNLLDGILSGDITGYAHAANVHVELSGAETLDAQTATALTNLPGFTNNGDLSIQDSSDYLLNPANHAAEVLATSVTLVGDETVSASTAARLAALPNFVLGSNHLDLASPDFADAPTLAAIADFGSGFSTNGNTLTMTQDALALTPTEYANLQSDNVVLNGHALSALPTGVMVTSGAGTVHVSGTGVDGATLNVYASSGASLSQTTGVSASFTANASEGSIGNGVVVTETVGASAATSESAPIIALEATVLTNAATADSATFLGSGSVQVGGGQFVNVYTTANAPANPVNPELVYDPTAHTLSLDIGAHAPVVLVTLGSATHPATILPAEIHVQHFT